MLTDGKYFEKYLAKSAIKNSDKKSNSALASIIKKLGSSNKFEKHILGLRKKLSLPAEGFKLHTDNWAGTRLIGYNYSREVEREADNLAKEYHKWGVPFSLREILARFLLCNEPLYFDGRLAKTIIEYHEFSINLSIFLPLNSKVELQRCINRVWPEIQRHQDKLGYKKEPRKRAFASAEQAVLIRQIHDKILKSCGEKEKHQDIINKIQDELNERGIEIGYESIRSALYRS